MWSYTKLAVRVLDFRAERKYNFQNRDVIDMYIQGWDCIKIRIQHRPEALF